MSESVVHLAGLEVVLLGRYSRQRCGWCGYRLIDSDYARMAMVGEWEKPKAFPLGKLVRVTEGMPRTAFVIEDERLPDDFCGADLYAEIAPR